MWKSFGGKIGDCLSGGELEKEDWIEKWIGWKMMVIQEKRVSGERW